MDIKRLNKMDNIFTFCFMVFIPIATCFLSAVWIWILIVQINDLLRYKKRIIKNGKRIFSNR